jgi:uncharacterized protein YndB with AHSA1/START domain
MKAVTWPVKKDVPSVKEVRRSTTASPARVFAVLADAWLFPGWVVGASRMRAVDAAWPAVGARLHHSFGVWPAVVDDETVVLTVDPPYRLVMQAKGWPVGEATVEIRIDPWGGGSMVAMTEDATKGPGLLVPAFVRQSVITLRNAEALRRLVWLAEGGAAAGEDGGGKV